MASPQKENGYTAIANEIAEYLARFRISGEEHQVLWVIWRKTYGWHKKEDSIALSQFFLATGMKKPSIIRAINKLIKKNIISKRANAIATKYRFNKNFDHWIPLAKELIVSKRANKSLAKELPTKETITKENNTRIAKSERGIIKRKIMFRHDTRKFDSDYEPVVNLDGEKVESPVKGNISKVMRELLKWAEQKREKKFVNLPKQYRAMKLMRIAKITPTQIKDRWQEMESERYWRQRGFDFADVASSFDKR